MRRLAIKETPEHFESASRLSSKRGSGLDGFLEALANPQRDRLDASHVAIVVAHPDDETIGIGGQLARLEGVTLVHVTDGAPHDGIDAYAHGFDRRGDYAAARRRELEAAVGQAGVGADALLELGYADQEAAWNLASLAGRLADLIRERRIEVLLTHAFEGGHPDHDATAFAVHAAARLLSPERRIEIVEMPFYHEGADGWVRQRFSPDPAGPEVALALGIKAMRMKRWMLAAHVTQAGTLRPFRCDVECFRRAPDHDFTLPPNGGLLLYERYDWGLTGGAWRRLVEEALAELGLSCAP